MAMSPLDIPMFVNITTDILFTMKYGIPSAKYNVGIHHHGDCLIMLFRDNNVAISDDRLTIIVDNYITTTDPENDNIWFINYPKAGDISLGTYAVAMGNGANAIQTGTISIGRDTKAIGK